MYSDIIPPKKNTFIKAKKNDREMRILKSEPTLTHREVYHTIDGRDRRSRLPLILFFITTVVLSVVYYSVFNNKTYISFESKTTILEIKDIIQMNLSEKNQSASTTLSYNLIYNNENKDRNIFAPLSVATNTAETNNSNSNEDFYILNATSSDNLPDKKIVFINETNTDVPVMDKTRFDVNGVTYYLQGKANIKAINIDKDKVSSTTNKYKVIGFKGSSNYDKFYAIDYVVDVNNTTNNSTTSVNNSNIPNEDMLSLIPENFIPLKKGYIYDVGVNQSALVVIDKKDFEKVLNNNNKIIQEYVKTFKPISDLVEYEININDYELVFSPETGLPIAFKNLTLEITPRIKKEKVAEVFQGFSKDTMKKIRNDIQKYIIMNVKYSPFWMSKVSDIDNISVEVK